VIDLSNRTTTGTLDPVIYELLLHELLVAGYPLEEFAAERTGNGLTIRLTFSSGVKMNRELLRTVAAYAYYVLSELSDARGYALESLDHVTIEVRHAGSELAERIEADSQNHLVYYVLGYVASLALKKGLYLGDVSIQRANDVLRISISMRELKALRQVLGEPIAKTWRYLALSLYMSPICSTVRSRGLRLELIVRGGFRRAATLVCT